MEFGINSDANPGRNEHNGEIFGLPLGYLRGIFLTQPSTSHFSSFKSKKTRKQSNK